MIRAYMMIFAVDFAVAVGMAGWGVIDIESAADAIPAFAVVGTVLSAALVALGISVNQ